MDSQEIINRTKGMFGCAIFPPFIIDGVKHIYGLNTNPAANAVSVTHYTIDDITNNRNDDFESIPIPLEQIEHYINALKSSKLSLEENNKK